MSYPKSGNTWLRFLIGGLVYGSEITFLNVERKIPDIYINSRRQLRKLQPIAAAKSHEVFDPNYRRVIYAVRDPRDVLVSYWFHHQKFGWLQPGYSLEDFSRDFLVGRVDAFGSWAENVGSWLGARGSSPSLLLVKYEDLKADTFSCAQKICNFLELERTDEAVQSAINSSTAQRMKDLESAQGKLWKATRRSRQDIPFVRSTAVGQWGDILPAPIVSKIEASWGDLMHQLGYL